MLETEMQTLRAEIAELRQAVNSLTATLLGVAHAALPTIPTVVTIPTVATTEASAPAPVPEAPTPAPTPAPTAAPTAAPTVDDLQALCSAMVRDNPDVKPKIKTLIQSFDGAKTLSKVPTDRLPELKAALEALV